MWRTIMRIEWVWGWKQNQCHFSLSCANYDDAGWTISLAIPKLVAVWWTFGERWWVPQKKCTGGPWNNHEEFWIPESKEFDISIHDWVIWFKFWGLTHDWHSKDPWWIRGVAFHIDDFFLGRDKHSESLVETFDINITMPEGTYIGHVEIKDHVRKRKRWFPVKSVMAWVTLPTSIPFPGKGENSWDCGEDGLCGYGSSDIRPEAIIAKGIQSVLRSRRRYGGSVNWRPKSKSPDEIMREEEHWGEADASTKTT